MRRTNKSSLGDFEFSNSSLSSRALVFAVAVILGIGVMATLKSMMMRDVPDAAVSEERELRPKNALKRVQLAPKKIAQPEPVYTPPPAEPAPIVQTVVRTKKASRAKVAAAPVLAKPRLLAAPKISAAAQAAKPIAVAPSPAPSAPAPVAIAVEAPAPVSLPVPMPVPAVPRRAL
ncbi:MAG: hypothetical protein EOP10_13085, partial [Proteobacteria bacterium]